MIVFRFFLTRKIALLWCDTNIHQFQNKAIMLDILRHLHSVNRWVVLVLLLITIFTAFSKWMSNKDYTPQDKKYALFALIFTHIQFITGLILLFISNKVSFEGDWIKQPLYRFFGMEHMSMMILGVIFITVGYSIAKRKSNAKSKFQMTWIFYALGLITILSRIPWPSQAYGASWY